MLDLQCDSFHPPSPNLNYHAAVSLTLDYVFAISAGVVNGDRSEQQQLLAKYADAVRARDAHALSAYTSNALLDSSVRRLLATRVIAGVWDSNTYMLHDLATKLVSAAQSSRCAVHEHIFSCSSAHHVIRLS
jgi:cobalamin biosynthesis Mg chelatase CobN